MKSLQGKRLRKGRCLMVLLAFFLLINFTIGNLTANADNIKNIEAKDCKMVVVQHGDTLWDIVNKNYPDDCNIRQTIHAIKKINALESAVIYPGQSLYLPELS